uniref:RNA helicase n=1 Tax=Strigamia maritima TaxID=126957 RepID=T1JLZ3_STRMM
RQRLIPEITREKMSETVAHVLDTRFRTGDVEITENVDFEGLFLSKTILQGLNRAGFVRPSPIQLKAIPIGRCGLDLIIQAKSGTGKTCVFTVVALESVIPENNRVQSLILAPTREIAFQNAHVVQSIGSSIQKLRSYAFTGGIPLAQDKLKLKCCHVATGTPGRIKQLIEEGTMVTDNIRLFVLDEADKLLEEGFQDTINWIYAHLPENKQIMAASATYTEELAQFLMRYMRNPTFVRLNSSDPALLGVKQYFKITPFHTFLQKVFDEKVKELLRLLNKISFNQCIIFSNYQARAQLLCDLLTSKGWPTMYISGSQDQQQRMHVMSTLHNFKCRILISTDLTSRGIDAEHVNLVLNLDVPWDKETYLHRIGRAGRFGTVGISVTFASEGKEEELLMKIKNDIGLQLIPIPDRIDNTIWQLSSSEKHSTMNYSRESIEKAPIAVEESTNPFENAPKPSPPEGTTDEAAKSIIADFKRDKKRDSVTSKTSSTRDSTDSTSTDQSIHTVISRCQSFADEQVIQPEPKEEDENRASLPSVISRCDSTDDFSVDQKEEGGNVGEEEEYVPKSVKNRIHEFERYIVKLIHAGDLAKSDAAAAVLPPDAASKRSILKDLRDLSAVKSSSGESDEFTKLNRRLVKSETWDSHDVVERKVLTKSTTIDAIPSATEAESILPFKPEFFTPKESEIEVPVASSTNKSAGVDSLTVLRVAPLQSECEVRGEEDKKKLMRILMPAIIDLRCNYKDLEADLKNFTETKFNHGDSVEETTDPENAQSAKECKNLADQTDSGDDKIPISKYSEECMKKICNLEFEPARDNSVDWKQYQEHWDRFVDEIRSIDSGQSEGEEQVVSSSKKTDEAEAVDESENIDVKTNVVTDSIDQTPIFEDDGIEMLEQEDSIQSDVVDRVTLLSKMTSEHEWVFSSSSVDAPDTENDESEGESTASETDNKEEHSADAGAERGSSRENILQEESAADTETTETTEEESSESSESEESEQSEIEKDNEEAESAAENSPDFTQWSEYWKLFSDWASQMHKPGPATDSTKNPSLDPKFSCMAPPFPFNAPSFPSQMPMVPQMPSMWPQPQFQNMFRLNAP